MIEERTFTSILLKWYQLNKRDLPWRNETDPYKIWLSEVILQQTRVVQGLPYYYDFVNLFPTIEDLASADETQVLRTWQGLGYYSRARNLHRCAQFIVEKFNSKFPDNYNSLLELPGVGPYTAAAIASFAFKEIVPVVDGNVYRVLSRVFGIETDISASNSYSIFKQKAEKLIDTKEPDQFNQALMEYGATVCFPKNPECSSCIFSESCFARINNLQSQLPVKTKKTKVRKRYFNYFVFKHQNKIMLNHRNEKDIWQNLFDFILFESDKKINSEEVLNNDIIKLVNDNILKLDVSKEYKHILSHQQIFAQFTLVELNDFIELKSGKWYDLNEILDLPKPVLISSYLQEYIF